MLEVSEGNTDVDAIRKAIKEAKACTDKPTLIKAGILRIYHIYIRYTTYNIAYTCIYTHIC